MASKDMQTIDDGFSSLLCLEDDAFDSSAECYDPDQDENEEKRIKLLSETEDNKLVPFISNVSRIPSKLGTSKVYIKFVDYLNGFREIKVSSQCLYNITEQARQWFGRNKMTHMVVVALLQQSKNHYYNNNIKVSLKIAKQALEYCNRNMVKDENNLKARIYVSMSSRYKRKGKLGKAQECLDKAKLELAVSDNCEEIAHLLYAEAGLQRKLYFISRKIDSALFPQIIKTLDSSMDFQLFAYQETGKEYLKNEGLYCVISQIEVCLDDSFIVENFMTHNLVTAKHLDTAREKILYINHLFKCDVSFTMCNCFKKRQCDGLQGADEVINIEGSVKQEAPLYFQCKFLLNHALLHLRVVQFLLHAEEYEDARLHVQWCDSICERASSVVDAIKVSEFEEKCQRYRSVLNLCVAEIDRHLLGSRLLLNSHGSVVSSETSSEDDISSTYHSQSEMLLKNTDTNWSEANFDTATEDRSSEEDIVM